MSNSQGLVFLHIPKTAGTTLRKIIDRQYPSRRIFYVNNPSDRDRFVALPEERRKELRVVQGHVTYGIHEYLSVPVDYITMLRRPVERVISLYYFLQKMRFPELAHIVEGKTLEEFADVPSHVTRNLQTAHLSGKPKELDAAALETAKDNLTRMAAFGLNERFDESLMLFTKRLGWRNVFYRALNANRNRPRRHDIPPSTIALIERNNALDMELYDFAARTFDARMREQTPRFRDELRRFQRLNPVCGFLNETYRRASREFPRRVLLSFERRARMVFQ